VSSGVPAATIDFLGVPVCALTTGAFIDQLLAEAQARRGLPPSAPFFVTYLNAACSNLAARLEDYRAILCQADVVYADGQAIVWASRWLRTPLPERVNAGDFFLTFCRRAADANLRLFFVGSPEGVAARAAAAIRQRIPDLEICGALAGYFDGEGDDVIAAVREARPDILIVGMGVPRQERWAWRQRHEFGVPAIWCVGALFEYYAGYRRRAPVWMRRAGLEWLFRLVLEPRRLWRRYVIGNAVFLWRVGRAVARRWLT
jgi:N-acetylglucosaminyldiphosphoundecaprenol N-acetyl-beta-D-mannosaminyltransferase